VIEFNETFPLMAGLVELILSDHRERRTLRHFGYVSSVPRKNEE